MLRMVDAHECGLDTRVLLWIIYGEIDAELYELDFFKETMAKFKTDDMLKMKITKEADFTSEVNKPLVELLAGVKIDEKNKEEIEDETILKIIKFIRKMATMMPSGSVTKMATTQPKATPPPPPTSTPPVREEIIVERFGRVDYE